MVLVKSFKLILCLVFLCFVCPFYRRVSAASSTDSLLLQSRPERFLAISRAYQQALVKDTTKANWLKKELGDFIKRKGDEKDWLLFETAILNIERDGLLYNDLFVKRAAALMQRGEAMQDTLIIAKISLMRGLYEFNQVKNYYLAFKYYLRAFELIKNLKEEDFPERDYTIYILARAYYEFFDYENAIRIGKVLTQDKVAPVTRTHIYNSVMLGMASVQLKKYREARTYFNWGLDHLPLEGFNNEAWIGIFTGNIGLLLAKQQKNAEAIPYLNEAVRLTAETRVWDNLALFSAKLATIYLAEGQLTLAESLSNRAHQAALRTKAPKYTNETYSVLSEYYRRAGQSHVALLYADSAFSAQQAWKKEIDVTLKHKAEMAVESEQHKYRELLLEKEKQVQILYRNGLILLIFMAIVVTYLVYNRQLLKYRHHQQQLLAQKQRAEDELKHAMAQLEQFTRNVQQKSELIESLSQQFRELDQGLPASSHYQVLEQLQQSILLTEENWHEFKELFEKVHKGFFMRLKEKLPGLSPAEVRFMALCKLNYSNKEMAAMLGVGTGTIRQHRSRLRRKLNISEDASIEEIAASI